MAERAAPTPVAPAVTVVLDRSVGGSCPPDAVPRRLEGAGVDHQVLAEGEGLGDVRGSWVVVATIDEVLALVDGGRLDLGSIDPDVAVVSFAPSGRWPGADEQRRRILTDNFVGGLVAFRTDALRATGGLAAELFARRPWAPAAWAILDGGRAVLDDGAGTTRTQTRRRRRRTSAPGSAAMSHVARHPSLIASEKEILARTLAHGGWPASSEVDIADGGAPPPTAASGPPPEVTVVLPFFNEERFLRDAIRTVDDQTLGAWELLLVDDGSTDASGAIAAQHAARDRRIRVLRHPGGANRGLPASRNLGLRHARAALLAFLDADDTWEPRKLERQVALLAEHPDAAMVCGTSRHRRLDGDGEGPLTLHPVLPQAPLTMRPGRFAVAQVCSPHITSPPPSNVMYRTEALRRAGGVPPGDNLFEDQRTMLVISLRSAVHVSDEVWSTYTVRADSLYGSLTDDLRTRRVQRRRYERWLLATALRGGRRGWYLFLRALVHLTRKAARRAGRAIGRRGRVQFVDDGNSRSVGDPSAVRVVVATRGRAQEAKVLLHALCTQSRRPDLVVLVGTREEDLPDVDSTLCVPYEALESPRPGLTIQRNLAIEHLRDRHPVDNGIVVFFDDDFRPHDDWLERCQRTFDADARIVGLTGRVLADGVSTGEVDESAAGELLAGVRLPPDEPAPTTVPSLYGCNMAVREDMFLEHSFCEELPLYGWLEDLDFSGQIRTSGQLVEQPACVGVHRGVQSARLDMRQLGYSEIANALWLRRRRTISVLRCGRILARRSIAAAVQSVAGSRAGEYRARLGGVTTAYADAARGRLDPMKIVAMADQGRAEPAEDQPVARAAGVFRAGNEG